jgi:1-acyl-sn-glycerol-3-phosphate acyltransferase
LAAALALVLAATGWRVLFRETLEQLMEIGLWPVYRIHAHGPGANLIPRHGALLVVSNHAAWFDPLWLAKILPRRVTPMMTSVFYDLPVLRWLMTRVVHAIRVPSVTYRREAPELREAVDVLDAGGCVVIFPEGQLRRRVEQPLRKFGRGVWQILRERPETPVIICWIEGGWGSYTSYQSGPPITNKPIDRWRTIDIAVSEPLKLHPALLADHLKTREFLRRACLDARTYLGLEPLDQTEPPEEEDPALPKEEVES